jgi:hypothetical protein
MTPAAGVKVACCGCFESVASSHPSLEYVTRPGHASGQRRMPGSHERPPALPDTTHSPRPVCRSLRMRCAEVSAGVPSHHRLTHILTWMSP